MILAAEQPLADPVGWLVNLGTAGIFLILFVTGRIRSGKDVESLEARLTLKDKIIEAKDAQIASLMSGMLDRAVPAIERSTQVMERLAPFLDSEK